MVIETVEVNVILSVDHAGQVCCIEQNGRTYEINDPMNVGNAVFGKVLVREKVRGVKFP